MTSADFTRNRDNFCYRHPDRVSFVLCQRCMRTICPECQTQAAVGVVCPDCLKQQQAGRTPAQKKAERRWGRGGTMVATRAGGLRATYTIMIVTTAVSLLQMIPGSFGESIIHMFIFGGVFLDPSQPAVFQPWRALTVLLVHGGLLQLGLNMLSLWLIGRILEPMLGAVRFVILYLVSGLAGSVLAALIAPTLPVLGASGAVFGTFGALMVIARRLGSNITGMVIILALNLAVGFLPGFNLAWRISLGGLVGGILVALIYLATRRPKQRGMQIALLVLLVIALAASTLLIPVLHPPAG